MKHSLAVCAIVASLGIGFPMASGAQAPSTEKPMRGMMGGTCPMMAMMGQAMPHHGGMGHSKGDGMGHRKGDGMHGKGMNRGQGMGPARMSEMADSRLTKLKSKLVITQAQEAVWNEYATAVKARVQIMQGMHETMMTTMETGNATDRMETRMAGMQAMVDSMKAVKPATDKLYAELSAAQRKTADQLIGMQCGGM